MKSDNVFHIINILTHLEMVGIHMVSRTFRFISWVITAWLICSGSYRITGANACVSKRLPKNTTLTIGDTDLQWLKCGACTRVAIPIRYSWEYRRNLGHEPTAYDTEVETGCLEDICDEGFLYCIAEILLSPVDIKLRGFYTCRAICEDGMWSSNAYVSVKGPPQFSQHPVSRNISQGENVTISCRIESDPMAYISWYQRLANSEGEYMHLLDSTNLTNVSATGEYIITSSIQLTGMAIHGEIFCQAINQFGGVDSTVAFINIKEIPGMITNISSTDITPTSLTIRWSPAFDGYDPISATHIKWQQMNSGDNVTYNISNPTSPSVLEAQINGPTNVYRISDLLPATVYKIWIAVGNNQGLSNWSEPILVRTNYSGPPAPLNISAKCLHGMIHISWTPIPYGGEYGQVMQYIVMVKDMVSKHKTINKLGRESNHISVHRDSTSTLYTISVQGVSLGGQGSTQRITYQCSLMISGDDTNVTQVMDNEITNASAATGTSVITKSWTPIGLQSSSDNDPNFLQNNYTLIIILLTVLLVVIGVLSSFFYRKALKRKRRKKSKQHSEPICAYIANPNHPESANEETEEQSHDEINTSQCQFQFQHSQHHQQQTNQYQTHIVNFSGEQCQLQQTNGSVQVAVGACGGLGRSTLLRMASNDSDYENNIASYAYQINLDKESRQHFYDALIPIEQLTTDVIIGEGEFGVVSRGYLNREDGKPDKVAVKRMKDINDNKAYETFIKEGIITKAFDHPNVLAIIGISLGEDISGSIVPLVVMPYMENGDLRSYLFKARVDQNVWMSLYKLVGFMVDIAAGMEYLASKKFVHRDLAARNCMLDSSLTVKIADFGLTRSMCDAEYYRMSKDIGKPCKIPVKWVAIESLRDGKFNTSSDVWSYGVTIWEIITQSQIPYPGISSCNLYQYLLEGHRLARPQGCPEELHDIMTSCWCATEQQRPSFTTLKANLLQVLLEWKKSGNDGVVQQSEYIPMSKIKK